MSDIKFPSALLTDVLRNETEYKKLLETLMGFVKGGERFTQGPALVCQAADGVRNVLCASLAGEALVPLSGNMTSVIIVPDEKTAYAMQTRLSAFTDGVRVFPMRDYAFHTVGSASHEWEYERLKVLREIIGGVCRIVIAVPEAALSLLPPPSYLAAANELRVGTNVPVAALLATLEAYGYCRTDTVEGAGQYSVRGDILDIFVPDYENPVRLEFFGDDLDAAGFFDVLSQRRTEEIQTVTVTPVKEIMLTAHGKDEVYAHLDKLISSAERKKNTDLAGKLRAEKALYENGEDGVLDKYLPFLYESYSCLLDYAKGLAVVCDYPRVRERIGGFLFELTETVGTLAASGELAWKNGEWCRDFDYLISLLEHRPSVVTDPFASTPGFRLSGLFNFESRQPISVECGLDVLCDDLNDYKRTGARTVLCVRGGAHAASLHDMLADKGIDTVVAPALTLRDLKSGGIYIIPKSEGTMEFSGFELIAGRFVFLCEDAAAGSSASRARRSNDKAAKSAKKKLLSYLELAPGDYVVHETHGIGRYEGIRTLTVADVTRDYITVRYAGGDALYVPCDQLDKLSKYTGKDGDVPLSKMGGGDWTKKKTRAKKAAKDMAKELIALYAERSRRPGYAFAADNEWQAEFEDTFEYEETEGQLDAVREIKADMEKPCPMDRLLCGDVGFGKTEVALRAAFKCVMDGKQTAVLVPTTILAMQHFRTFSTRMHGYPIRVEMLSRYVSPKKTKEVLAKLATGEVDIVIGTHKLLGKGVTFKDLGLLIVDEEQRFGVTHKERLKEMAKQIDVLTLTATPIPRTFNMALVGIRDMSVLEEAPIDRYPVQTFVTEYDEGIVNEAIRKELRRGGQVFYLHNRVEDIDTLAGKIKSAHPDAAVAVAHGQMDEEQISAIWYDMTEGKIDILVCTTIIETGVDVPNANTLIIEDADRFGLAQLHQLRGRVGRSGRRAYAYFTYRQDRVLNETSQKRLTAIREFTEFGSGFRIAMRDMEIRGAGNLLGAEQSGHLQAIGYELFVKLLENAVLEEQGKAVPEKTECAVDLGISAYIPEKYIRRPAGRIEMYKRISEIRSSADAADVTEEMTDRYGKLPPETKNLIMIASVKARCTERGIVKVVYRPGKLTVYPANAPTREESIALAMKFPGKLLTSLGKEPCFNIKIASADDIVKVLGEILKIYSPKGTASVVQ